MYATINIHNEIVTTHRSLSAARKRSEKARKDNEFLVVANLHDSHCPGDVLADEVVRSWAKESIA